MRKMEVTELKRGNLVATFPVFGKEFGLSFELNVKKFHRRKSEVLRLSNCPKDYVQKSCIALLFFLDKRRLSIRVHGVPNLLTFDPKIPRNKWMKIKAGQDARDGKVQTKHIFNKG